MFAAAVPIRGRWRDPQRGIMGRLPKDDKPAGAGAGRKVTQRDIARICGVSPMAVSMAINHKDGVSKKTAEMIRQAVRKLNYTPNLVAKSLRVSSTKTIGVIMSDSSPLLFTRFLKVIGDAAEATGYSVVMANTDQNPERERSAIDVLMNKRIDGMIIAAPLLSDDAKIRDVVDFGIPLVMAMRSSRFPVDSVSTDNFAGAYAMVDYLAKSGSRDIYMINLPRRSQGGALRLKGYADALRANGLSADLRTVQHVAPQIADGRVAMEKLLDRGVHGGAVFCGCDLIAIGAMEVILGRGLRIPRDIRVGGFDDIDMLSHLAVPLTTMRQPIERIARMCFDLLLQRLETPSREAVCLKLPGELIVRKST